MTKRDELIALDPAGLEAAVRECARITAPEISDVEYERIKADNSPRYQNTRAEMERAIRAYLRAAKPALSSIVTCCVTGAIPGDGGACGDCDPCLLGEASVPAPVKTLIAEKNSLIHRVGELEDELDSLRRLASSDSGVKVKPLVWRDHRPDSFPEPAWSAQTSFGFYNIEEVSASDSPAYVVRLHAHHFVADKDSLDEAKAAAQRDYEARIKSALITAPPADAGMREAFVRVLASLAAAISILERTPKAKKAVASDKMFNTMLEDYRKALEAGRTALTAPGATTKSDGDEPSSRTAGGFPVAAAPYHAEETGVIQSTRQGAGVERGMDQCVTGGESATTNSSPSDPSSTRSDRWVCAARQRGITLDPKDCDWPVCGCDPLANKVLDTIAESGFVIVPKEGAPMTDDQIKHMVDRFLCWTLPENFNPDGGVSFKRLENRHHHPDASPFYPMPVGTNLFDAVQATAMVRHMLDGLPSSTRSGSGGDDGSAKTSIIATAL